MNGAKDGSKRGLRSPSLVGERGKIIAMGVLLALLLFAFLMPDRKSTNPGETVVNRPPAVDLTAFELDKALLERIKDATPLDRTGIEHAPWMHLIRKSYNIGPSVVEALGGSENSPPVAALRDGPAKFRGQFVSVKGKLLEFEEERKMHPIPRATAYKGLLETSEGLPVLFFVSKPLSDNILAHQENPWVRVEGFFMKIRDEHRFTDGDVLGAPLIIGPRLRLAYPDWKAIDKLDVSIIKRVKNGIWDEPSNRFVNDEDMRTMLVDSQEVPLWHMASFVLQEVERKQGTKLRHSDIFELKDQYSKFKSGEYEQGASLRVRGQFIGANIFRAVTNPVGIKYWSEVWIQIPRMGAKMVPLWIPRDIGEWKRGDGVDVDAFFFKNYRYEPFQGGDRHTPLFVAGDLRRFKMVSHPATLWTGIGFAIFLLLVAIIFFQMNRRAKRESLDYKKHLIERRRSRRPSVGPVQTP